MAPPEVAASSSKPRRPRFRIWTASLVFFAAGFGAALAQQYLDGGSTYEAYVPFQCLCFLCGLLLLFLWIGGQAPQAWPAGIGCLCWIALALASAYCVLISARP